MASRSSAIRLAEERFPLVSARFAAVYGMQLPEHVIYTAAFFLGLSPEEQAAAERIDASALFGVGEWFLDGALEKKAWADERTHGRFRRDPPELVTFVSGISDGSHWGLFYDLPSELPRLVAHNWARDSAETSAEGETLLASIRERASEDEGVPRAIDAWLDELVRKEEASHRAQKIPAPHPRVSHAIGSIGPTGVRLPDDWTSRHAASDRGEAYRKRDPRVLEWIETARAELDRGEPGRALLLGQELHWLDADAYRAACTELLTRAYRALGRDALAGVVEAHHAARDMPSVSAYLHSSSPLYLAAQRGDAERVAALLLEGEVPTALIDEAAYVARTEAVQELLFARSRGALALALSRALTDASPAASRWMHEAASVLAASKAQGESREVLLARLLTEKQYEVRRRVAEHGDALDVAAWEREADRLLRRADGVLDPTEIVTALLAAQHFTRALALLDRVDLQRPIVGGGTILHFAVALGAEPVARALLALGADPERPNAQGQRPRDLAKAVWQRDKKTGAALLSLFPEPGAPPPPPAPVDPLGVGKKVRHAKFGEGEITAVALDGKLTIRFADQPRVLLPKFVTPA